ncbi:hypothetical protein D3C87_1901990 [compost metagenome]
MLNKAFHRVVLERALAQGCPDRSKCCVASMRTEKGSDQTKNLTQFLPVAVGEPRGLRKITPLDEEHSLNDSFKFVISHSFITPGTSLPCGVANDSGHQNRKQLEDLRGKNRRVHNVCG